MEIYAKRVGLLYFNILMKESRALYLDRIVRRQTILYDVAQVSRLLTPEIYFSGYSWEIMMTAGERCGRK
jgi:hypothetical protein